MIENKSISFKVKKEYKEAILNNISNNIIKDLLFKGLNAIVNIKSRLDHAIGPELKEIVERINIRLILFEDTKFILKIKKKNSNPVKNSFAGLLKRESTKTE